MKNILINVIKKKNFFLIIKKIFKRFEKNTSVDAKKWAKLNTKQTTENFCRSINSKDPQQEARPREAQGVITQELSSPQPESQGGINQELSPPHDASDMKNSKFDISKCYFSQC